MKRSILFWLYFIVAILLAIYMSVRLITLDGARHGPVFVRNISISADAPGKDLSALAASAAIAPGTRTYAVDLNSLAARIGAVPSVRAVAVRRLPNGNLSVHVKLHHVVAQWTDGENFFPLSVDGTIVNTPGQTRDNDGILFRGDLPKDVSQITNAVQRIAGDIDYMEWIENRRWNLVTRVGITVMLPEKNAADAISALIVMNTNHGILNKQISVIDMRDSARILVK